MLSNERFVSGAPAAVVDKERKVACLRHAAQGMLLTPHCASLVWG